MTFMPLTKVSIIIFIFHFILFQQSIARVINKAQFQKVEAGGVVDQRALASGGSAGH
jgi:hypothetical protein